MTILLFIKNYWKQIIGIFLLVSVYVTGHVQGSAQVQNSWDKEKAAIVKAQKEAEEKNAQIITDLEVQHSKDTDTINRLHATYSGGLHLPSNCPKATSTSGSLQTSNSGGQLPSKEQSALDYYTAETQQLMYEADEVVNQCRVVIEWAKTLPK